MLTTRHVFQRLSFLSGPPSLVATGSNIPKSTASDFAIQAFHIRAGTALNLLSNISRPCLHVNYSTTSSHRNGRFQSASKFSSAELQQQTSFVELDEQKAYRKLRQVALLGNYPQIQKLVEILVQKRGEKPNARLYDALILANVDEEYGSAAEATRLLHEMTSQGMVPDSGTYHAVLRVST